MLLGLLVIHTTGCWLAPEKVALSDPRLRPLLAAMDRVDRTRLGFTPIAADADVRLERSQGAYDAMLHIYGPSSRTIAFRKTSDGGYRWIGEQEIHSGPRRYTSVDGTFQEQLVITYELEPLAGPVLRRIHIAYHGDDPRLENRPALTLETIRPVLEEWNLAKSKRP